jgi:hypothetical protein
MCAKKAWRAAGWEAYLQLLVLLAVVVLLPWACWAQQLALPWEVVEGVKMQAAWVLLHPRLHLTHCS